MKLALHPRLGRAHRRMSRGARTDGHHAGPDVARFGATTGPAVLATWAALFEDSDATPQFVAQRHRWRRRV